MAEFLIYNKDHWSASVKLTPEQVIKFKGCYKKGDVVEVRPDGYWDKRGFNKEGFAVVKNEGMSFESAQQYAEPLTKEVATTEIGVFNTQFIARRKYQITNIVTAESKIVTVDVLTINTKTEASLTDSVIEERR